MDPDARGRALTCIAADAFDPGDPRRPINLALVEAGQAAVYRAYCSDRRYQAAEDRARAAGLGIWSRAGAQQRPWDYRHEGR